MSTVILDLPPLTLLSLAALVPTSLIILGVTLPFLFTHLLPTRARAFISNLVAPPSAGPPSSEASRSPQGSDLDLETDDETETVTAAGGGSRTDGKIVALLLGGVGETLAWTVGSVVGTVRVARLGGGRDEWVGVAALGGVGLGWALSTVLLLSRRSVPAGFHAPAPMLHFTFYAVQIVFLLLHLISLGLHHSHSRRHLFDSDTLLTLAHAIVLATLLCTTMSMPLAQIPIRFAPTAPAADVAVAAVDEVDDGKDEIYLESPEDRVTLGSWVLFEWVQPLLEKGKKAKLGYKDVWRLPRNMESEGVEASMKELPYTRIIPRVFFSNSLDLTLSITLGLLGSALSYLAPYYLRQILESLSSPVPNSTLRRSAYIYTLLAFLSQLARAQVDLIQLWCERRAISRTKTFLMGDVYRKALVRRDVSGIVLQKEEAPDAEGKKKGGKKDGQKDGKDKKDGKGSKQQKKAIPEARGTSSTGKIVSLMGGDANKVSMQLMSLSSIVGAPFELVIAVSFLYQLLGWTAIAGLAVMAVAIPVNQQLTKRRIKIHRAMLSARDSRMEVLNELINSIRFIKYSAAEDDWLKRVHIARETELGQLLKTRLNGLGINALWNFVPDLVTLVSFSCYCWVMKKELTVPVAFTSLALFAMVRNPMTMLPMSITNLLQTWVSVQRLEAFFQEPEVEPWVTALRPEGASSSPSEGEGIGIDNGTFVYDEEAAKERESATAPTPVDGETAVAAEEEEPKFELRDITVDFAVGKLSLVCGATGSGKSSLFLALLGEMTTISGTIRCHKATVGAPLDPQTGLYDGIAYASQLPWIRHASIRENILFGSPFDQKRYDEVIEACALRSDLKLFDAGDETEVGEKGISLSGGQKARVALARAVYSRAKTVLLDDPLAAVDSHTARHLFTKCLRGPLLQNRTVILITHHVSLCLSAADYVVRMSEGRVALQGPVDELDKNELTTELIEEDAEADDTTTQDSKKKTTMTVSKDDPKEAEHAAAAALAPSTLPTREPSPSLATPETRVKSSGKLIETEARATGRVKWRVYSLYLASAGFFTWFMMIFLIFAGRAGRVADRSWFKVWGESYRSNDNATFGYLPYPTLNQFALTSFEHDAFEATTGLPSFPSASDNVSFYLAGYAIICLLNLAVTVVGILSAFQGSFRASRKLFTDSLRRVVFAPFRHFDVVPTGRILNRFSQDFNTIDGSLVDSFRITFTHLSSFVVNVGVVVVVSPNFIIPAFIIVAAYVRYALLFVKTSRDLRRLESNARSPIFSKFGETLQGIVTCRAFGAERRFVAELYKSVDTMSAVAYSSAMANRYLLYRFDFLGAFAVGITTVLALVSGASPGLAALAITSSQSLVQSVYWASRFVSQLEVDLNAVERVVELLDTPQEPAQIVATSRPPANWPSSTGGLSLEDLTISYAPNLPPVLHGISVDIPPRAKVGLVGRTGCGKSTLATSLLRFVEPTSGKIIIDGIDVTKIGLNDLRRAVTLIPQEAVLFSGTVRSNLDPFNNFTDADCLEVLERVGLINTSTVPTSLAATPSPSAAPSRAESPVPGGAPVEAEPGDGRLLVPVPGVGHGAGDQAVSVGSDSSSTRVGQTAGSGSGRLSVTLSTPVTAGGNNFSAGQRQLLALARALLRRNRVIIMDEATASVDFETDQKIQHVIRDEFSESLVLTVAHRLLTVVRGTHIMVLDAGRVVEFDTPATLLRNREGVFRKMAEKAAEWRELREAAGLGEDE